MSTAGQQQGTRPSANRPAKVSLFLAAAGIATLANFATGIAWINPAVFVGLAVLCALAAIIAAMSDASGAAVLTGTAEEWRCWESSSAGC
ncbi:hypothetical protein ACFQY7_43825 [Actinomadura luteofluorescens]|uniref:hypothetical protein n=1 Tax=Actinomadura luteofluorescens TaxID=46163 RepID=UPI00363B9F55